MIADLLIPLVAVGLAELGDKTQLSILVLASRTKDHLQLLGGVLLAFFLVDGFAIMIGSWITNIVPINFLKIGSGIIFIFFGIMKLRDNEEGDKDRFNFNSAFLSGFILIAITEWGDKTQLASGLLAAQYDPLLVLTGTMVALTLLSLIAIWLGKIISKKINKKIIAKIAGIVFIIIGITFFLF